ncbi:MAG: MFS transporter [Alphaproteobacteria bacterium]|nr:MFS transporter [Alphaproteobacteria bacterium]
MGVIKKIGFTNNRQLSGFLAVVFSGQIIYSAFEAFKGTFYTPLLEVLGVSNTELGLLFTLIGTAMFFYVPAGWVNNRFSIRSILLFGLAVRFVSMMIISLFSPSFNILIGIAFLWGIIDAIFWPAVVNGVGLLSGDKNKGLGFGLLESIRRAVEMGMNTLIVLIMVAFGGAVFVFQGAMIVYTLLIIPVAIWVWKYAPENVAFKSDENKNTAAFKGLIETLKMPSIWLAGMAALTVYWSYIALIYTIPYLQAVFNVPQMYASVFGIINTGAMGVLAGVISGFLSDFIFKSPSKMMFISLVLTTLCLLGVLLLPKDESMLMVNIVLLLCFSFSLFLAKSIILAPIAEINLSPRISGSAMSIGSFLAYASIFWAYTLNGSIIDNNEPIVAYQKIFSIGVGVAAVGSICCLFLIMMIKKQKKQSSE